jgi:hypothetical protein
MPAQVASEPSAMCGQASADANLNLQNTIISIPDSHDGNTPVPVVMAFHAAGNPNTQLSDAFGSALQDQYVVLYPKSGGNEWNKAAWET